MPAKDHFFDKARETMDWEERRTGLSQQFVNIFQHAYRHTKAYKEIFSSVGIEISDIKGLDGLEKLMASGLPVPGLVVQHSQSQVRIGVRTRAPGFELGTALAKERIQPIEQPGRTLAQIRQFCLPALTSGLIAASKLVERVQPPKHLRPSRRGEL